MRKKLIATVLMMSMMGMVACTSTETQVDTQVTEVVDEVEEEVVEEVVELEEEDDSLPRYDGDRNVVTYFANWTQKDQGAVGEVAAIPWEQVTVINHAFWRVEKEDEGVFYIESTEEYTDLENDNLSEWAPETGLPINCFAQYEYYSQLYPDVEILISIGGWNCSGNFSEMALTQESRKTFIDSCIALMQEYEWIDGIDVDWEYPGQYRTSADELDEGNPVFGVDKENYTLLLQEMEAAFDAEFGEEEKLLTVCLPVASSVLFLQDVQAFHPYVDLMNLMAYDMNGSWSGNTAHQAYITGSGGCGPIVEYLLKVGVDPQKINLGTAFYTRGWDDIDVSDPDKILGQMTQGVSADNIGWYLLKKLELEAVEVGTPGFHVVYDETALASYMWNDDPDSAMYQTVLSYDNEESIIAKANYIEEMGLGGGMIWASYYDSVADGSPLTALLSKELGVYDGELPEYVGEGLPNLGETYVPEDYGN
ncbi:MAG: glycosyl hydrolase family 18 protein [Eubacteriales bacterium]